jgi:hypothetical protein
MSIWIYRKGDDGKKSIYTVYIPFEILIVIIGVIAALLIPRYVHNFQQLAIDSIIMTMAGFILLLISKISQFKKGIWNSWGSKQMRKPFKFSYWFGYALMVLGVLGSVSFIIS